MTLPDAVRAEVERALGSVLRIAPVAGGCISETFRVETAAGPVFLKHHPQAPAGMFAAEADGLRALRAAAGDALRIPEVLATESAGDGARWIALEWLEPGPRDASFGERLGRGLAALHRGGSGGWGWGARELHRRAPAAERRGVHVGGALARPPAHAAARHGADGGARCGVAPGLGPPPRASPGAARTGGGGRGPSLLHGDLWSGNVLSAGGEPALIDPAVYRGHREADLAMAELFGGFDARFHAAYREAWPLLRGYAETRRAIYQLYYLLVHVNLFGGGYGAQAAATLRRALAATG